MKDLNQHNNFESSTVGFRSTAAYADILLFLTEINEIASKESTPIDDDNFLIVLLNMINSKIEETPLDSRPQRFANCAVVEVYHYIENMKLNFSKLASMDENDKTILHLYLDRSFGSKERLDYGTGHELFFVCFMLVCYKLDAISIQETIMVFRMYFRVVRNLIYKFNLEPAGSHGPWAIDDYQFLPFLIGSAELINTTLRFEDLFMEENHHYIYSEALHFCIKHKCKFFKTHFKKHSAALYAMKNVSWTVINSRIFEMMDEEVMGRDVVMQHFIYSKYLPKKSENKFKINE